MVSIFFLFDLIFLLPFPVDEFVPSLFDLLAITLDVQLDVCVEFIHVFVVSKF